MIGQTAESGADKHYHDYKMDNDGTGATTSTKEVAQSGAKDHVHKIEGDETLPAGPDKHIHKIEDRMSNLRKALSLARTKMDQVREDRKGSDYTPEGEKEIKSIAKETARISKELLRANKFLLTMRVGTETVAYMDIVEKDAIPELKALLKRIDKLDRYLNVPD